VRRGLGGSMGYLSILSQLQQNLYAHRPSPAILNLSILSQLQRSDGFASGVPSAGDVLSFNSFPVAASS
jgi:hypothetical protein